MHSRIQPSADSKPQIRLVIAGIVKDAERTFLREYRRFQREFGSFFDLHWIVVESDSSDDTLGVLNQISQENAQFIFTGLGNLRLTVPSRMERLAQCRNRYLEMLSETGLVGPNTFLLVMDLDDINKKLNLRKLLKCIESDQYEVFTCNQLGPYYDISALRATNWNEADCWQTYRDLVNSGHSHKNAHFLAVGSKMIRVPEHSEAIEVDSAFGGAALYKTEILRNALYSSLDTGGQDICEHVAFHRTIRANGGRIAVAPWLINSKYNEHTFRLHPLRKAVQPAFSAVRVLLQKLYGDQQTEDFYQNVRRRVRL